jgi:hypothetical protein
MLEQHGKIQKGLFGETNGFDAILAQLTGAQVEFKSPKTDEPLGGVDYDPAPLGA